MRRKLSTIWPGSCVAKSASHFLWRARWRPDTATSTVVVRSSFPPFLPWCFVGGVAVSGCRRWIVLCGVCASGCRALPAPTGCAASVAALRWLWALLGVCAFWVFPRRFPVGGLGLPPRALPGRSALPALFGPWAAACGRGLFCELSRLGVRCLRGVVPPPPPNPVESREKDEAEEAEETHEEDESETEEAEGETEELVRTPLGGRLFISRVLPE
jgi:hypothetical protein